MPRGDDDIAVFPPVICVIPVVVMATERREAIKLSSAISVQTVSYDSAGTVTVHCNVKYQK